VDDDLGSSQSSLVVGRLAGAARGLSRGAPLRQHGDVRWKAIHAKVLAAADPEDPAALTKIDVYAILYE
jgi:hypothetical protein